MPLLSEILAGIRAKHGSQVDVAKKIGIPSQLLGQYEKGKRNPKLGFYRKWKSVFGDDLQALIEENDETNVSREAKKGTYVESPSDNKQMANNQDSLKHMAEGNTEYLLVPKMLLQDKHRLVSIEQMEKDKAIIDKLLDQNEKLVMRVHQLEAQLPSVEKRE